MKEYFNSDIAQISNNGIVFHDGYYINFTECINEWSKENEVPFNRTNCVAVRNILSSPPCFIFYTKSRTKIMFVAKGIFRKSTARKLFDSMKLKLESMGYSSFDLT